LEDFFGRFGMQPVSSADFDAALAAAGDALVGVYFWGDDCFNCDQFKKAALLQEAALKAQDIHWLHANVYQDTELGRRFSLHGVPTFYFFHRGRKLGRITSWPGLPQFQQAISGLRERISASGSA